MGRVAASRAWARFERGQVVIKAEVGSQLPAAVRSDRIASLYVNDFNTVARATYARIGFAQTGTFAMVLLD